MGAVAFADSDEEQIAGAPLQDDLLMVTKKVEALDKFLATDDGKNLLAGYKRASNILKAEEKKDGPGAYSHRHAPNLRIEPQEHKLAAAIARAREETAEKLEKEDFAGAMHSLSKLREPVDAFFEHVTVNAANADLRLNRLRLLSELRRVMSASRISGRSRARRRPDRRPPFQAPLPVKFRGAGEMIFAAPPPTSSTDRPRSLVPSGLKRNTPSAPLKPDGLVSTLSE